MVADEQHGPKIRETIVRVNGREYPRVVADFGVIDGARKRKTFKPRRAAERAVETWRAEQKMLARKIGKGAERFLTGDVQDAAAASSTEQPMARCIFSHRSTFRPLVRRSSWREG